MTKERCEHVRPHLGTERGSPPGCHP
jgi:hypothetical protein